MPGMTWEIPSCIWYAQMDILVSCFVIWSFNIGHLIKDRLDVLKYLLPLVPTSLISSPNLAENTPLHWAAVNSHLAVAQALVQYPDGSGVDLIDRKNSMGRSPLGEAEHAGWEEGAVWMCKVMNLEDGEGEETKEDVSTVEGRDIEVEIEDAEGRVAKMSIPANTPAEKEQTI